MLATTEGKDPDCFVCRKDELDFIRKGIGSAMLYVCNAHWNKYGLGMYCCVCKKSRPLHKHEAEIVTRQVEQIQPGTMLIYPNGCNCNGTKADELYFVRFFDEEESLKALPN